MARDSFGLNYSTYRIVPFVDNGQLLRAVVRSNSRKRSVVCACRGTTLNLPRSHFSACFHRLPHSSQALGLVDAGHAAITKTAARSEVLKFSTGW